MSDEEIVELEHRVLGRLHRHHGPDMTMETLSVTAGETYEGACLVIERMTRMQLVEIVRRDPGGNREGQATPHPGRRPERYDKIRLTSLGTARFYDLVRRGQINVNGDIIRAEAGAIVTNRSIVANSFNTFADKYDPEVANALMQLEQAVTQAKSAEATELLDEFLAQLKAAKPKPSVLKVLFARIQEAAPAVIAMTDVVAKVSSLFSK